MQGELPFLVVHGDGVWTVVYALLIAGTARLCVALRAMLQRRRARSEVHARQQMKTEGDVVALRAKVVVGEAATLSQEGFVATERSKELCIEHEGERIRIVGDVFVEHGAHERTGYFRIPRGATASMSEGAKPWSATILRKVGVNDDVIVTGTRGVVASGEPPEGYREPGSRSAIIAGDKHVVISAIRPAGRPPAWGLAWTGPLLGFAFAWLLLLRWVGMTALEHVGGEDHLESPLGNLSPVAIAAATPTTRNEALSHLESATYDPRTEASLRLAIGFAELQGRCPAHLLQKRGMFEEALAAAKRCGPSPTATQLVYLGRYAEAAATLPKTDRSYIAVASAVATGRWHDAAVDIEANEDLRSRCLGAMFRAFAGETDTFANVSMWVADAECKVMETQTVPIEAQRAKLESLSFDERKDFFALRHAGTIWASLAGEATHPSYESYRVNHGAYPEAWFAPFAANAYSGNDPETLALIHEDLLALAIVRGDFKQARSELGRAATTDSRSQSLEMAIQIEEGTTEPPPHRYASVREWGIAVPILLRLDERAKLDEVMGGLYCPSETYERDHEAEERAWFVDALRAARRGDGAPLLSLLRRCRMLSTINHDLVLAVLPFVHEKRRELVTAIQYQGVGLRDLDAKVPFALIAQLVLDRDIARLGGDEGRAKEIQAIIDRHATVLADRRKLIAFFFLADTLW